MRFFGFSCRGWLGRGNQALSDRWTIGELGKWRGDSCGVGVKGNATHDADGAIFRALESWAILGSLIGDAVKDLSIESHLGVDELVRGCVLEHIDVVLGVERHVGLAISNGVAKSVRAIDNARLFILNPEIEICFFRQAMSKKADDSGGIRSPLCLRDTDGLLPEESPLGDFYRQGRAAEILRQLRGIDGCADTVTSEISQGIELSQIDCSGDRFPRFNLNRRDFIIRIGRRDRSAGGSPRDY